MAEHHLGQWLYDARERLKGISEQAGLEVSLVASSILNRPRSWILAHTEEILAADQLTSLHSALDQLENGIPLPYILGVQEFYGMKFSVNPDVLIPRPETELLVEQAIGWLKRNPARRNGLDVGTGSGCIPIALLANIDNLRMTACDRSGQALAVAKSNAAAHQVLSRLDWVQADLATTFKGPFDLVCANLPYIPSPILIKLAVAQHEPLLALDGGEDGLSLIRRLMADLPRILAPGGLALLEIETNQGKAVIDLARSIFPNAASLILQDLAGLDRTIYIENTF